MSTHKTKLVHCNTITYVYDYVSSRNISTFTFENESVRLQRLILTNFVEYYTVHKLVLNITTQQISTLQSQLEHFLSHIAKKGLKYLAVLQNDEHSCLHVLTNKPIDLTPHELTELWGDIVELDILPYNVLLNEFIGLASDNQIFTSNNLKKPRIMHNKLADAFIEEHELLESDEYDTYEIQDEKYGVIIVNEYRNIP